MQIGERFVNAGDEQVLAVRRHMHVFEDGGLPDGRDLAGGGIDRGELGSGVIDEELFVVRVLQHVFQCGCGRAATEALLDVRSHGDRRHYGRGPAIGAYGEDQQRFSVGHPLDVAATAAEAESAAATTATAAASAHYGVHADAFDAM